MDAGYLLNGRYLLAERLGEGGMSVVWRAHDQVLGREVAVKVLAPRLAGDAQWRRRIRLEARSAARLSHPNVTGVYDFGETPDNVPFVVMELLRGPTLSERLMTGPLPPAAALRICAEVAAGLAAAHAEGLVHRDVKPANVMLTRDAAKVLDFGIVGVVGIPDERSAGALVLGTPAYLAPERLLSDEITPASDVYAFGLLLYRCLTGRLPWDSETTTQMVTAHVSLAPEPLPDLPGVPPEVRELCMSCLAKDAADRPPAVVAAARLARAAGIVPRFSVVLQEPARAEDGEPTRVAREPAGPVADRRRALLAVGGLVAVAALLVGVTLRSASDTPRQEAGLAPPPAVATAEPPVDAPSPAAPSTAGSTATAAAPERHGKGPGKGGDQGDPGKPGDGGAGAGVPTDGGVIVAACVSNKVSVLQVLPAAGVSLVSADLGLHTHAKIEFDRAGQRLRYVVDCPGGAPVASAA